MQDKIDNIKYTWGLDDGVVKVKGGIRYKQFHLNEKAMLSLAPRTWIYD